MIEVLNPAFEDLVDPAAQLELISSGFKFTEGPVWHAKKSCLYFSDIPADTLYCYQPSAGVTEFRKPSHFSNGLSINASGELVICEHRGRAVSRQSGNNFTVVVSHFKGKKLNSPNDIIVSRDGSIYFSDPIYGLQEGLGGPAEQELEIQGVYRVGPGEKEAELLFDDFERPNGLAFNHDDSMLLVIDTVKQHIRQFEKKADGSFTDKGVFAELLGEGPGRPDGMKLDIDDNVFCTGPGGIWVFSSAGGLLGKIILSDKDKTANLAWGDDDRKSLYITSSGNLFRLRCKTTGMTPMDVFLK